MSTMLLAQVSDTHLYKNEYDPLRDKSGNVLCDTGSMLRQVLDQITSRSDRPDLLLLTGDLSHDGSVESYRRLHRYLAALAIPYHWIPGNHDDPTNMSVELAETPFHFFQSGWNFALLSSKRDSGGGDGEISADALEHLGRALKANPQPTLVAVHHPPLSIGSWWLDEQYPLRNADDFRRTIGIHEHVKTVVFGHAHQEFDQELEGIRYLGTPSTCDQFVPRSEHFVRDNVQPGYRLLWLRDDGSFETEVVRLSSA